MGDQRDFRGTHCEVRENCALAVASRIAQTVCGRATAFGRWVEETVLRVMAHPNRVPKTRKLSFGPPLCSYNCCTHKLMRSKNAVKATSSLTVLRDEPLFATPPYDSSLDTFAYDAFAKVLLDVLQSNQPPISIGLFGPWGIGKSTIINILFGQINSKSDSHLFPIYFNAWKYSGDSFRRQFLLEVAAKVYGSRTHEAVQRLERLNYTDVLTKSDISWAQELKAIFTGNVIKARRGGLIRIILGLFLMAMGATFSLFSSSIYPAITGMVAMVAIFVLKLKFEDVFAIQENQVFDPKLIFPEQFEKEFQALIDPARLDNKHAVIVIDDIDRCDSSTIKDILISTKNFVGHGNAYFIIPCDDSKVINVFEDTAHKSGYRDEMLRKYFNVGLRIPPISNQDLIDFANRMARETKLPEDIVQLAVLADYRDARRIKHFANNFLIKLQIAKARSSTKHLPELNPERELQLAKLVIIEDCAPLIFSRIAQHPPLLQMLESSANSATFDRKVLVEHRLETWDEEYPGLKRALVGARYVTVTDLELLISLKADNLELQVPSGTQFRTALLQGAQDTINGLLPEIGSRNAQQALADLIEDSLRRATGPLLSNCISSSLSIGLKTFFTSNDARRIARRISQGLLRDDQRIWLQSALTVTDAFDLLDAQTIQDLLKKYVNDLSKNPELPPNLPDTVAAIFPKVPDKRDLILLLNEKFMNWWATDAGLAAMASLSEKHLVTEDAVFPSTQVVLAVVNSLDPRVGDIKTSSLRKEFIFRNWDPALGVLLAKTFWLIIQNEHSQGTFTPALGFILAALCEKPEIFGDAAMDQSGTYMPSMLNRAKTDEDRNLVRDSLVHAAISGTPNTKSTLVNSFNTYWQNDSDERVRRDLAIAEGNLPNDLSALVVKSQADMIQRERQGPSERTVQRLTFLSEFQRLAPPDFLNQQFVASLSVNSDTAFSFWEAAIRSRRDQFNPIAASELINGALDLVSSPGGLNQRKAALLKLAIEFFPTQASVDVGALTHRIVGLLWHSDDTIRNNVAATLSFLRDNSNIGDVRISLNAGIHEHLRRVTVSTFPQYQSVIDALVANKSLWNESSQRAMAQLAVSLSSNESLRASALAILESVDQFTNDDLADVIHVLNTIEAKHSGLRERAHTLLQRVAPNNDGPKAV